MKSILFKDWGVRAIRNGQKTMTRRPINCLKGFGLITEFQISDLPEHDWQFLDKLMRLNAIRNKTLLKCCPYSIGDTVYVKEVYMLETEQGIPTGGIIYRATDAPEPDDRPLKWKSPLFLPENYARLFLTITDIKVEKACDISEEDAQREGIAEANDIDYSSGITYKKGFEIVWHEINGPDTWDKWVWVYTFEIIGRF